jgi:hypothetical protein
MVHEEFIQYTITNLRILNESTDRSVVCLVDLFKEFKNETLN